MLTGGKNENVMTKKERGAPYDSVGKNKLITAPPTRALTLAVKYLDQFSGSEERKI